MVFGRMVAQSQHLAHAEMSENSVAGLDLLSGHFLFNSPSILFHSVCHTHSLQFCLKSPSIFSRTFLILEKYPEKEKEIEPYNM